MTPATPTTHQAVPAGAASVVLGEIVQKLRKQTVGSWPTVECEECGRVGSDDFVWYQGEIMLCANEIDCKKRAEQAGRA